MAMIGISMADRHTATQQLVTTLEGQHHLNPTDAPTRTLSKLVVTLWLLLAVVMISLYLFFN